MRTLFKIIRFIPVIFIGYFSFVNAFNTVDTPTLEEQGYDSKFSFDQPSSPYISCGCPYNCGLASSISYSGTLLENLCLGYYPNGIPSIQSFYKYPKTLTNFWGKNNQFILLEFDINSPVGGQNIPLIKRYLYDPTNGHFLALTGQWFLDADLLVQYDGASNTMKYYRVNDDLTTTYLDYKNIPTGFVLPRMINIPINYVFNNKSGYMLYQGTDYNYYFVNINTLGQALPFVGTQPGALMGAFFFLPSTVTTDPVFFNSEIGQNTVGVVKSYTLNTSGNVSNIVYSCITQNDGTCANYSSGTLVNRINMLSGATMYFNTLSGQILSWNLNCIDPNYTSCHYDTGDSKYKCADENGNFDPSNIECKSTINYQTGGGGGSVTQSGSSTSTTSSSTEQQTCIPVAFSGSSTFSTSENLDPNSCNWRTYNGQYACQDQYGHACLSNGDSCLKQIYNPNQYASGSTTYNGDINKYNCSTSSYQCEWQDANTCNSQYCVENGAYCQVRPEYLKKTDTTTTSSSAKGDGNISGGIVGGFGFQVGTMPGVGTGVDCGNMFDGATFLYQKLNTTSFTFDFSNNFQLAQTEWSCPVLGVDVCNFAYFVANGLVKSVLYFIQVTLNFILSPVTDALQYIGIPTKGADYCFFGERWTYNGRVDSYYSYVDHQTINIEGKTKIDYFIIIVTMVALFVIIFK